MHRINRWRASWSFHQVAPPIREVNDSEARFWAARAVGSGRERLSKCASAIRKRALHVRGSAVAVAAAAIAIAIATDGRMSIAVAGRVRPKDVSSV